MINKDFNRIVDEYLSLIDNHLVNPDNLKVYDFYKLNSPKVRFKRLLDVYYLLKDNLLKNDYNHKNITEMLKLKITEVLKKKGDEYSTEDRLHNFKLASRFIGEPKIVKVCEMFQLKHIASIDDIINGSVEVGSALIDEKVIDAMNYCILHDAILKD